MKFLFLLICIIGFICCNKPKQDDAYYIISKVDSIRNQTNREFSKINNVPSPPPLSKEIQWYSDVVFIFDTGNIIYLYQTTVSHSYNYSGFSHYEMDSLLKYPCFIGLNPAQLLAFRTDYFMEFLNDNNAIFRLDSISRTGLKFFHIVSDFDTIKNESFYKLEKLIGQINKSKKNLIIFNVRKTTEEERVVLGFKRTGKVFNPKEISWYSSFYDGKTIPFTQKFDSIERYNYLKIKSKDLFKEDALKILLSL